MNNIFRYLESEPVDLQNRSFPFKTSLPLFRDEEDKISSDWC